MLKKMFSQMFGKREVACRGNLVNVQGKIYERDEFLELVDLERERVHRNGTPFSLVLVSVKGDNQPIIIEIANKIKKRLRRIDQVGWYDRGQLGILLPLTTLDEAKGFTDDIRNINGVAKENYAIETITYPDKKIFN